MFNPDDVISTRRTVLDDSLELPIAAGLRDYKLADNQYEILMKEIKDFESELDENEEVALQLASFGQSVLMQVTEIGYHNPSLIFFYGYVNNQWSQLIQHVSQLNFLLTTIPKADPSKPPRRIGFFIEESDSEDL